VTWTRPAQCFPQEATVSRTGAPALAAGATIGTPVCKGKRYRRDRLLLTLEASRPTVTVVAGTLQRQASSHIIVVRVTITDRKKLESASRECYRAATKLLLAVTSTRSAASA
jgi:hypothetical protein